MPLAAFALLLTSLLFVTTPSFAGDLNKDCRIFALNQLGFNNAQNFTLAAFERGALDNATAINLGVHRRLDYLAAIEHHDSKPTIFTLSNGTLYTNDTATSIEAANQVQNGTVLEFIQTLQSISQFCAVANTDPAGGSPDPTLAVDGDVDSFSICKMDTKPTTSAVVYNASAHGENYDIENCVNVQIRLIISE